MTSDQWDALEQKATGWAGIHRYNADSFEANSFMAWEGDKGLTRHEVDRYDPLGHFSRRAHVVA